jgi:formylmethanofuran dehydrogenase subunit E
MELEALLYESARDHYKLCPRQILGVRLGLAGLAALGFETAPSDKRLLVISETDGCFVDGLSAATACSVGRRSLRVQDYGKTAAVFVDTVTGQSLRIAPALDLRQKAVDCAPAGLSTYQAQMQAYRSLPAAEMFTIRPVWLADSVQALLSRPGLRVICENCGEEIMNEREILQNSRSLCRACAQPAYYRFSENEPGLPQAGG